MQEIREANKDDFLGIMTLYRQLQPDDPVLSNGADREVFDEIIRSNSLHLFVLLRDKKIRATSYLNIIPNITRSASPYAVIENVVTDEYLRGQGIGKQLMAVVLDFAWSKGCYKAMLQTGSKREATHAFYRSCGFRGDEKTGYIARPN